VHSKTITENHFSSSITLFGVKIVVTVIHLQ